MTTTDILRQVAERQIALVPSFDGKSWMASVDEKGDTITTKKRKIRSISATASTPAGAVESLLAILDNTPQEQELLEEVYW